MGQFHGTTAELYIDEYACALVSGACTAVQGDLNSITFTRSKNNPEVTTFGDDTINRLSGLRDVVLDATGVFNSGAVVLVGILDDLFTGSLVTRVQYFPGGNTTGEPVYTASMRLNNYAVNEPLDGVVTVNFSMAIAEGSLNSACVA